MKASATAPLLDWWLVSTTPALELHPSLTGGSELKLHPFVWVPRSSSKVSEDASAGGVRHGLQHCRQATQEHDEGVENCRSVYGYDEW